MNHGTTSEPEIDGDVSGWDSSTYLIQLNRLQIVSVRTCLWAGLSRQAGRVPAVRGTSSGVHYRRSLPAQFGLMGATESPSVRIAWRVDDVEAGHTENLDRFAHGQVLHPRQFARVDALTPPA